MTKVTIAKITRVVMWPNGSGDVHWIDRKGSEGVTCGSSVLNLHMAALIARGKREKAIFEEHAQ